MMEPTEALDNHTRIESDVLLRDIQEILNTNTEMNGAQIALEQHMFSLPQSSSLPTMPIPPLEQLQQQPSSFQQQQQQQQHQQQQLQHQPKGLKPYIRIVEEPTSKGLRFRYLCEGRSAGSIPGINSAADNKTFPTIEIVGYKGEVIIVVSCVTKNPPYRPHPHNLVGKEGLCKEGVCTLKLTQEPLRAVFSNLGIQCVKKKDIRKSLEMREHRRVDPFKTKFAHKDQPSSIDLNILRLCFQAYIRTESGMRPLDPVVSEPIYDKKAKYDLVICRLCSCSAKVSGGDEIIMLCERVNKDDIKIRFFETINDQIVWDEFAEFQQSDIHKQTAIAFKTPRYRNADITKTVTVHLQLIRPSDGASSEPVQFDYYPDPDQFKRKRQRKDSGQWDILRSQLQKYEQLQSPQSSNDYNRGISPHQLNPPQAQSYAQSPSYVSEIKAEFVYHDMDSRSSNSTSPFMNMNMAIGPPPPSASATAGYTDPMKSPLSGNHSTGLHNTGIYQNFNTTTISNNSHQTVTHTFSGGSLTPLSNNDNGNNNSSNMYLNFQGTRMSPNYNIIESPVQAVQVMMNQQQLMQQQQQQQQSQQPQPQQQPHQIYGTGTITAQFQPIENVSDVLPNAPDEGPTLSGLLATIDFDDLPLSNLSITT